MNKVWTETHWRGLAVAIIAVGAVAAARAGGENAQCAPSLERAQTALRDAPPPVGLISSADVAKAARPVDFDKPRAACAARLPTDWNRDAQRTLASTITMTTTNVIDRNPAHAITLASAAQ